MGKWFRNATFQNSFADAVDPWGILGLADSEEDTPASWDQAPEFPEAKGARESWWKALSGYNADNNYGAISPDWADIWSKAQKRLKSTYWGDATSPGLIGKVRASVARRNVSDSPSLGILESRLAAQEAGDTSDLASELATRQAEFGESARQNWLANLASLSGRTPVTQYNAKEEGTNWLGELLKAGIGSLPTFLAAIA